MAIERKQLTNGAILPLVARRSFSRSCDQFRPIKMTPHEQRKTAELAFRIWLDRGFRRGSPQEDWIQAVQQRAALASKNTAQECPESMPER
jgi:hypothetical protein